jgi:hypothetical protein
MKSIRSMVVLMAGLSVLFWAGLISAQDLECTNITRIEGRQVTLMPEDKNLKPFVIETDDTEGLKVGDRVWVKDGKIVKCALPGKSIPPKKP